MRILKLVVQIILALLFIMSGAMKAMSPYEELLAMDNMGWVADFSAMNVKTIGVLELLAGLGLVLPLLIKRWYVLVPLSALGLMATMIGAAWVHINREESIIPNVMLFVVSALVFWLNRHFFKK
ncbi:MAG: DoxX family protein [Croceimicrobium sp.]|mgnify:CR=1 FL=1|nr:DoxX family protein [Bacteroidota bacterium]